MAEPTPADPSKLRVSDAEREKVVALLQTAASEGRLTLGEFSERSDAVYGALTRGELERVTEDLPVPAKSHQPTGIGRRSDVSETAKGRRITSIMSESDERLVGEISEDQRVLAVMGDVTLDLRDAVLPTGEVRITGTVVMGTLRVAVPDGIEVRNTSSNIMGDVKTRIEHKPTGHGPVVWIKVTNVMGEVQVADDAHLKKRRRWSKWWNG